jgi:hypothetical protein
MSCSNLRPLEPDLHGTGRWNFRGKSLAPEEIEQLTKNGVDWNLDLMPDGRLKKPQFRECWKKRNRSKQVLLAERQSARGMEYDDLPEPKPSFLEWAARRDERNVYEELERIGYFARRTSERTRAFQTILEYTKTKPKQQVEVANVVSQPPDQAELIQAISQIFTVPVEKLSSFLKSFAN